MSVELQDQRKVYTGNGTATVFAFPFTIEEESQVKVVQADTSGTETVLTLGTDYTVTINATSGVQLGDGSVTLASALPAGYKLALVSNIPEKQERTFPNNTPYYQEQVEGGIDKNTRLIQQLKDGVDRSIKVPATSSKTPEQYAAEFVAQYNDIKESESNIQEWLKEVGTEVGDHSYVTAAGSTTARTLAERFADVINVKDYGAVGDGVTDDTEAIQAALIVGGCIFFPCGSYLVSSSVGIYSHTHIMGQNAEIVCASDIDIFTVSGDGLSAGVDLGSNVTSGATAITTTVAHGLVAGDMGFIWSQRNCLSVADAGDWCLGPHESLKSYFGEPFFVRSISGNTINISTPLVFPDYRIDDTLETDSDRVCTTVHKINFAEDILISGLNFIHTGEGSCFSATWAKDVVVSDLKINRGNAKGLSLKFTYCYNIATNNISIYGDPTFVKPVTDSDFYKWGPVDVVSCWNFSADNWSLYHTVTGFDQAFYEGKWPSMYFSVTNCYIKGLTAVASTTHPGSFKAIYRGNTFDGCAGGISLRSRGAIIDGNHIITSVDSTNENVGIYMFGAAIDSVVSNNVIEGCYYGIVDHPYSSGQYILPTANRIYESNLVLGSVVGIDIQKAPDNSKTISNIVFRNNYVEYTLYGTRIWSWRHGITCTDNIFSGDNGVTSGSPIVVQTNSTAHTFRGNRLLRVGSNNSAYSITSCTATFDYPVDAYNGCIVGYDEIIGNCKYINGQTYSNASRTYDCLRISPKTKNTNISFPADCRFSIESNSNSIIGLVTGSTSGFGGINIYDPSGTLSGSWSYYVSSNDHRFSFSNSSNTIRLKGDCVYSYTDAGASLGMGSRRWSTVYASTSEISTSDERVKDHIVDPDEDLMRAWGKVSFKVFQFKDAISEKGNDSARLHVGVIAQQVIEAFASEGLDATRYGLLCYDKWDAQDEVLDEDGNVVEPAVEAGDRYGVRYEEALALECAYQRWRLDKLERKLDDGSSTAE